MRLEKYVFFHEHALRNACRRRRLPLLFPKHVFILYTIKHLSGCNQSAILRHAEACHYQISHPSISRYTNDLMQYGLVAVSDGLYSLSPDGRQFLSEVRRYLVNLRSRAAPI
jgi:hypothetical protein